MVDKSQNYSFQSQKENNLPQRYSNQEFVSKFCQRGDPKASKSPINKSRKESLGQEESFESQGYRFLIKDIRKCLDKKNKEEEESLISDNFKVVPQYE